jgi:hypothetical protein
MGTPAKQEGMTLDDLLRSRLDSTDTLARVLTKVLIDKSIVTTTDLLKEILKEQGSDRIVDTRGKKWVR